MNCYKFKDTHNIIPISQNLIPIPLSNLNKQNKQNEPKYSYSLSNSFFDPCQSSPPNEFMQKLKKRINSFS